MTAIAMHLVAAKQYLSKVTEDIFMPGQQVEMLVKQFFYSTIAKVVNALSQGSRSEISECVA